MYSCSSKSKWYITFYIILYITIYGIIYFIKKKIYLGSFGVHTTMSCTDKESHEFYSKLGFVDLNPAHEEHPGIKTMCRSF